MRLPFSTQALRHHSVLAWLHVPSNTTMPSMSRSAASWFGSASPFLSSTAISRPGGSDDASAEPRCRIAQRRGSAGRPSAFSRLAHDRPTLKVAFLKCRAAWRAQGLVLLLRVLKDQERDLVCDRLDAFAHTKRRWLAAMRARRCFVGGF